MNTGAPERRSAPVIDNVWAHTPSTSATAYQTPSAWRGYHVTIRAVTAAIELRFASTSDLADNIVAGQDSALSAGVLTVNANTGYYIPANEEIEVYVPRDDTDWDFMGAVGGTDARWVAWVHDERT